MEDKPHIADTSERNKGHTKPRIYRLLYLPFKIRNTT